MEPIVTITGIVVSGKGIGRTVSMPTANLKPFGEPSLPPFGVYATLCTVGDSTYVGVTNIGCRPTVDSDPTVTIETFLPDVSLDLYGKEMEVKVIKLLRPIRRMHSLAEVKEQVAQDAAMAKELLSL